MKKHQGTKISTWVPKKQSFVATGLEGERGVEQNSPSLLMANFQHHLGKICLRNETCFFLFLSFPISPYSTDPRQKKLHSLQTVECIGCSPLKFSPRPIGFFFATSIFPCKAFALSDIEEGAWANEATRLGKPVKAAA